MVIAEIRVGLTISEMLGKTVRRASRLIYPWQFHTRHGIVLLAMGRNVMLPPTPLKTPLPIEVGPLSGRILRGSERFSLETPLPGGTTPGAPGTQAQFTRRTLRTPLPGIPGQGSAAAMNGTGNQRRVQTPLPDPSDIAGTTSRIRRSVTGKIVQTIDVPQAPLTPPVLRVAQVARSGSQIAPPISQVAHVPPVAPEAGRIQGVTMMCIHCQKSFSSPINHSFGTVICTHCGAVSRVAVHACPPLKRSQV